jgi:hypothetical protein
MSTTNVLTFSAQGFRILAMISVLLVDGVGNSVVWDVKAPWPPTLITLAGNQFVRTVDEEFDGMKVYRLRGFLDVPPIRHVFKLFQEAA